eukprot:TRINITY_DN46143_c0_g1_i1.p1 TRINITY_DN46143_c0_g1~~TRINITY_DN46143_c0_g1_i1.p1  ORF type:complete len:244 (-),score=54.03 TRINITY_DN46143_c0_g1_i1:58-789(-)
MGASALCLCNSEDTALMPAPGKLHGAEDVCETAARDGLEDGQNGDVLSLHARGTTLLEAGDFENALAVLRAARKRSEVSDTDPEVVSCIDATLAASCLKLSRWQEAVEHADRSLVHLGSCATAAAKHKAIALQNLAKSQTWFGITIDRTVGDEKLGVDVDLDHPNEATLLINAVTGGLVGRWNEEHPEQQVGVADRVVEINGLSGNRLQLVEECKQRKKLHIRIQVATAADKAWLQERADWEQ